MASQALHVVTDTDRRGAQIFAEALGRQLATEGHPVRLVALAGGSRPSGLGVDVLGPSRLSVRSLHRLRSELRGAGVVVGFGSSTLPALTIASAGTGVPFVYRSIGESAYWANTPGRRIRVGAMLRRTSGVIALWQGAADDLVERYTLPPERMHVIPRGVSTEEFPMRSAQSRSESRAALGLDDGAPVVCAVGALAQEKNLGLAIDAVAALPEVRLMLAGSGPEEAWLRRRAADVAPGRVVFLDAVEDVVPVYHAADSLLLTSTSEGMPGVVIEAGMCGVPTVATAVGAVPEMIVDGATGCVVPRSVGVTDLAEAVWTTLSQSDDLGAAMRARCVERYEIGVVSLQWLRMLEAASR